MKPNIVVAASGSGSNFRALLHASGEGILKAKISGLIAGRKDIGAVSIAQNAGVPVYVMDNSVQASSAEIQLLGALRNWNANLFVLAGFLRKIPDEVVEAYKDRILNIHPSLLPLYGGKGFYGIRVHEAVLNAEETHSGCTVHLVNEAYDEGRILAQSVVDILPKDEPADLAARVLAEEHKLYATAIQSYIETLNF